MTHGEMLYLYLKIHVVCNSSQTPLTMEGQKGHADRLRWMRNIDLLTKSRADAEEERAARQTSAHESSLNVESSDFSRSLPRADGTQIEPIFQMEDDSVSIQNYLTYNNPDAVTSPQYRFVINILSTAKVLNILPTSFASHSCFGNFSSQEIPWHPWRQPEHSQGEVTETTAKKWRENIASELKMKRQALTTQVDPDSLWQLSEKRLEISSPYQHRLYSQRVNNLFAETCTESNLNYKQQVAFKLFTTPLKSLLLQRTSINDDGESNLRNRSMYLGGSGGTGKSRVIHAIKALFDKAGCKDLLMVTATTGSAANLIGGSTIDSVCKFSRRDRSDMNLGDYEEDRPSSINNSWNTIRFLIIDEVSMVGCHKLSRISKALQRAKHSTLPFGGLFVLFGGDFHQLPPIQDKCLYHNTPHKGSIPGKKRDISYREGFQLWKEVTNTTVLLTQNYRAVDQSLAETLERLRVGNITSLDIDLLKRRVFGHPLGPDTSDPKWQSAILITTRNAVRQAWNNQAALRHALKTRGQVYISPASDKGIQCRRSNMIWTPDSKTEFLATWNVLCIDGPAVVTSNVAVELGIANGTDVIIREVIPHPTDQVGQTNIRHQVVQLTRPPICVFVELQDSERKWNEIYHIEHPTWFPIMTITEQIKAPKEFGTQKMFERTQIPLTLAFAMSDHKVSIKRDEIGLKIRCRGKECETPSFSI
jgi:PIF1-like helicase